MEKETPQLRRAHIYEIDLIRAITVFSVVAIHSLTYTNFLTTDTFRLNILFLVGHALHYNREMFMFVTGLVLTYVYYQKPFSAKKFWLKRFSLVLIPYVVWSLFYVVINNLGLGFFDYVKLFFWNLLTGDASFQLYYILLIVQFYAVFPLFLVFLKKVAHRPWLTLGIAFTIQLAIIAFDYFFLQSGPFSGNYYVQKFVNFQDRIFLLYEFFFILGGFGAIYIDTIRAFLAKHAGKISILFFICLGLYTWYYFFQIATLHESTVFATTVLQPSVVIYSTVAILFASLLATLWTKKMLAFKLVKLVADTSFGVYFIHIFFLTMLANYVLPHVSNFIPDVVNDVIVLIVGFSASVIFSYMLLKIPFFSWVIGKPKIAKTKIPV